MNEHYFPDMNKRNTMDINGILRAVSGNPPYQGSISANYTVNAHYPEGIHNFQEQGLVKILEEAGMSQVKIEDIREEQADAIIYHFNDAFFMGDDKVQEASEKDQTYLTLVLADHTASNPSIDLQVDTTHSPAGNRMDMTQVHTRHTNQEFYDHAEKIIDAVAKYVENHKNYNAQ